MNTAKLWTNKTEDRFGTDAVKNPELLIFCAEKAKCGPDSTEFLTKKRQGDLN